MMAGDDGDDNNAGDGDEVGEVGTYIKSYIVAILMIYRMFRSYIFLHRFSIIEDNDFE